MQVGAAVFRDPAPEDMTMGALDDVDGIDPAVAGMLGCRLRRPRPGTERRLRVEPLGVQPDAPPVDGAERMGFDGFGHDACNVTGFAAADRQPALFVEPFSAGSGEPNE